MIQGVFSSPGSYPGDTERRVKPPYDFIAWSRPKDWPQLLTQLIVCLKSAHSRLLASDRRKVQLRCELMEAIIRHRGLHHLLEATVPEAMERLRDRQQLERGISLFDRWFHLMQSMGRFPRDYEQLMQRLLEQRLKLANLEERLADLQHHQGFHDQHLDAWNQVLSVLDALIRQHEKGCVCMKSVPEEVAPNEMVDILDFDPAAKIVEYQTMGSGSEQKISETETMVAEMFEHLDGLQKENATLRSELSSTRSALTQMTERSNALEAANKKLLADNKRLLMLVQQLGGTVKTADSTMTSTESRLDQLHSRLKSAKITGKFTKQTSTPNQE